MEVFFVIHTAIILPLQVFARRSLKQKPGPHVEKQDTEMETEKLVARQQENNDKDQAREGKVAGNNNTNKSTIPQVRSVTDAKRISEPSAGQGIDHSAPAGLLSGPNLTSVELLPNKKELNKLKVWSLAGISSSETLLAVF